MFDKADLKMSRQLGQWTILENLIGRHSLSQIHKGKRVSQAQDNLKTHFSKMIFADESKAILAGPDG